MTAPVDFDPTSDAAPVAAAGHGAVVAVSAPDNMKSPATGFDANSTLMFQSRMKKAPVWFCSFLAGNSREKARLGDELAKMKGAWPLLMKQRNGGKWTQEEKQHLKSMVRSASAVSPYLFIWAVPGSMVLLPFLAWYLDMRRKMKARKLAG